MIVNSVYTDGKDEYKITLESLIENNDIKLIRYSIVTGATIGF